jgi:predicted dehydrogenase
MSSESNFNRRHFIGTVAAAGAILAACSKAEQQADSYLDTAPEGKALTAGLIGCGGRGTGAALNFMAAGPNLEVTAIGDTFQDRVSSCREQLEKEAGKKLDDSRCFVGLDAYQKVIDSGVDVILIATPPYFRPQQFAAAVDAKKHVFMEKPVAVDPTGIRSIIDSAKKAQTLGLSVVTGTQRRHQPSYNQAYQRIKNGAIGEILSARIFWNQGQLWYRERRKEWSDLEWIIRDWVNWVCMSGDHIVEQHVHNIDVACWFLDAYPVKAIGMGGRARRVTGDQFDFFSVDFEMPNGVHVQSMCRQVDGCANDVSEYLVGTSGTAKLDSKDCVIYKKDGTEAWKWSAGKEAAEAAGQTTKRDDPYVLEHVDLVNAIRTAQPFNEAENTAKSTLAAIMGRTSAYTGAPVTWDEMMGSDMKLGSADYALDKPLKLDEMKVPVPGKEKAPKA